MKKTRILVIAANPQDGTSFYRAWGPLSKIEDVELVYDTDLSWATLSTIDLVFFQRPAHHTVVKMIDQAKSFNLPIWCDWDDDGFNLETTNPAYEYFAADETQASLREALRLADVCTVSTQHLKEVFLKEVPGTNIAVIPNAVDETLFSLNPSNHERNKTIVLRGGSSHVNDWGQYRESILRLAKENSEWTWAVMGFHPEWMNQIENIKIYQFSDIPSYFQKLMELRPSIGIVPLTDTLFNRSKSCIGFYEMTLAGAAVVASDLPEFQKLGCATVKDQEELYDEIDYLMRTPYNIIGRNENALKYLFTLGGANEIRKDIIEKLVRDRKKYRPIQKAIVSFDDKQFHDYELSHGFTPDSEEHFKLTKSIANWILNEVNPRSALELGCGVGGILLELLKSGVNAYGFEKNPHSVAYFKERHPVFQNHIIEADITTEPIVNDSPGDIVYSIECFEHINMPEEWWNNYLTELSKKFRHFYFSSTPYHTIESFDKIWGHVNVRLMSRWKKLLEANGWEFIKHPRIASHWDMFYKSKNIV